MKGRPIRPAARSRAPKPAAGDARESGHTCGMKTAVSLPDEVFEGAERLARKLGRSRSELYREALIEYVARHTPAEVTEALDRVVEEIGTEPEGRRSAARRILERSEW